MTDARTKISEKYDQVMSFEDFSNGVYWRDHICEFPGRFKEIVDKDNPSLVAHEPVEGSIIQQGTPVNANNLNHRDHAIWSLYKMVMPLLDQVQNLQAQVSAFTGASGTNSFVVQPAEFEIIDGYYDTVNNRVTM